LVWGLTSPSQIGETGGDGFFFGWSAMVWLTPYYKKEFRFIPVFKGLRRAYSVLLMKTFILCFLSGNELEDIRVCIDFETAMKFLEKHKKSRQVLEYNVTDGITDECPLFAYSYTNDVLVKHVF